MPELLDIDADPFLKLLTDALRAGPGSPEWHQAISRLRAGGERGADEYRLLIAAREHLESGRSYRAIRAGPEFTRKVLAGIEAESLVGGPSGGSAANIIAIVGAIVVLSVLAVVGLWLLRSEPASPSEELSSLYFGSTLTEVRFRGPLPPEWKVVGPLAIEIARGLRPATTPTSSSSGYDGGGVVTTSGIVADQPFAVEATFQLKRVTDDLIPQLLVTDQPDFTTDRATAPHELVWLIRGGRAQVVLPGGQFAGDTAEVTEGKTLTVRLVVGRQNAQVISAGRTLWTGPSQLGDGPRYVGVRFLRRGSENRDAMTVQSIKVMQR